MPDFLSHALFAQQLLERGGFAHHADCAAHSPLFRLGSQGPDLFYYLAYVSPGHDFSGLADRLHGLRAEQLLPLAAEVSGPAAASELSVSEHAGLKRRCDPEAGLKDDLTAGLKNGLEAGSKYAPETGLKGDLGTGSSPDPEAGLQRGLETRLKGDPETDLKNGLEIGSKYAPETGPKGDLGTGSSPDPETKPQRGLETRLKGDSAANLKNDLETGSKYAPGTGLNGGLETGSKCDPGTWSKYNPETGPQRDLGGGATVFQLAQARAYLCGVIAHLCLDEAAHPYIERRSAEIAAAEPGVSESCAHVRLESCFEARQLALETGRQPKEYDACGDLPADSEERRVICAVWQRILAVGGQPPLDSKTEKALLHGLRRLPLLFSLLFDRHDIAKSVLDFFHRFAKGDATLRWHIKRPYDPANTPLAASDAEEIEARYAAALAAYPSLLGPEII